MKQGGGGAQREDKGEGGVRNRGGGRGEPKGELLSDRGVVVLGSE